MRGRQRQRAWSPPPGWLSGSDGRPALASVLFAVVLLSLCISGPRAAGASPLGLREADWGRPATTGETANFSTDCRMALGSEALLGAYGSVTASSPAHRSVLYGLEGALGRPIGSSLRAVLRLDAWTLEPHRISPATRLGLLPGVEWSPGRTRVRIGGGLAGILRQARWTPAEGFFLNGSRTAGSWTFEAGGRSNLVRKKETTPGGFRWGPDSLLIEDPAQVRSSRTAYHDLYLKVGWGHGAVAADVKMGRRLGPDPQGPRSFGGIEAAVALTPSVALTAGYAFEPSIPELNLPARQVSRSGLSFRFDLSASPASSAAPPGDSSPDFRLKEIGQGRYVLYCRVSATASVELSGDFCDWTPLQMYKERDGWWKAECALTPGVHRISLRIDRGDWIAPPGLSPSNDGYDGEAGMLVVGRAD
jgi:hypothetical protein